MRCSCSPDLPCRATASAAGIQQTPHPSCQHLREPKAHSATLAPDSHTPRDTRAHTSRARVASGAPCCPHARTRAHAPHEALSHALSGEATHATRPRSGCGGSGQAGRDARGGGEQCWSNTPKPAGTRFFMTEYLKLGTESRELPATPRYSAILSARQRDTYMTEIIPLV